jgi:hypothetical protein
MYVVDDFNETVADLGTAKWGPRPPHNFFKLLCIYTFFEGKLVKTCKFVEEVPHSKEMPPVRGNEMCVCVQGGSKK